MQRNKILRTISQIIPPRQVKEGKGAIVQRSIGGQDLRELDPFLLFDYANVKQPAGFPEHPHRGFETISYCLEGKATHEDSKGHEGVLLPGDVQWMTAGKGIMHSEQPDPYMKGFQIWVNLPSQFKLCEPYYQDFKAKEIPVFEKAGVKVKVISGQSNNQKGVVNTKSPVTYLDAHLEKNTTLLQEVPANQQGIIFVYEGSVIAGQNKQKVETNYTAVFRAGEGESIEIISQNEGAKFLFLSGQPLKEKPYQYGPFVMDSEKRLQEAIRDYQEGINGFEGAHEWKPKKVYQN